MENFKIFLDTDVLVAAILSSQGASFTVIHRAGVKKIISLGVKRELAEVCRRLKIKPQKSLLKNLLILKVGLGKKEIARKYAQYVLDPQDAHIVAAAHQGKARFLLSYNLKHYQLLKIKNELGILVTQPGFFLQYLRNQ